MKFDFIIGNQPFSPLWEHAAQLMEYGKTFQAIPHLSVLPETGGCAMNIMDWFGDDGDSFEMSDGEDVANRRASTNIYLTAGSAT